MSDTVIRVENLSKRYVIGHQGANGDGLRHQLEAALRNPLKWFRQKSKTREQFWALKDVSFEVKQGEVVGIIGRNGAGKSTLLKILSRITEPTAGCITIHGRVASLLEVGTGFHQELTGRENIFLNGAILGMSKAEIKKKFDDIVAFSEVEKFLDTPVKHYSSGMYVRLAFAVAAHLEPEILIVDEVLAVGDAEFQKKCLGKMQEVSKGGRTILFVSHNMHAIQALCQKGIVLEAGRVKHLGSAEEALRAYSKSSKIQDCVDFRVDGSRPSISSVRIDSAQLSKGNLVVDIGFKSPFALNPPIGGVVINSPIGTPVFGTNNRYHNDGFGHPALAEGTLRMTAKSLPIHGGTYILSIWLADWHTNYDVKRDILAFEFKMGHPAANVPNPETIGFIDTAATWHIREN